MANDTVTLTFTADELEIIYYALNCWSLEQIHKSETWGNFDANLLGREDIWHRQARKAGNIQLRVYEAEQELEQKATTTVEPVVG